MWDGSNWGQIQTLSNPGASSVDKAIYDAELKAVILPNLEMTGGTWEWTGTNWVELAPVKSPSPRMLFGLAPNPANGLPILFSGENSTGAAAVAGTWEFVVQ